MGFSDSIKKLLSYLMPEFKFSNTGKIILAFLSGNKFLEIKQVNNNYQINIDLTKTTPEQEKIIEDIYPELRNSSNVILQKDHYIDLKEYILECKDIPILKFFKDKICQQDYEALRDSIFINKKFNEGNGVGGYLEQLSRKFGVRGRNICNLYGEGYFDSFIKSYYLLLESQDRISEFSKVFNDFVMNQPITYFVNRLNTQEIINKELLEKIEKNKRYGVKRLTIHGISVENKNKILEFLKIIENKDDVKIISWVEENERISVTLEISNKDNPINPNWKQNLHFWTLII